MSLPYQQYINTPNFKNLRPLTKEENQEAYDLSNKFFDYVEKCHDTPSTFFILPKYRNMCANSRRDFFNSMFKFVDKLE